MTWLITPGQPVPVDPVFNNVSLLLHGDGTNGSTTITDNSPSPKTVTAFGNAQISTAQSKFGGASIAFDGDGDYATAPISSDFEFGTGDFTVEGFVYVNSFSGIQKYVNLASIGRGALGGGSPVTNGWTVLVESTQITFFRYDGSVSTIIARSTTVSTGTWHHIAVSRVGTNLRIFLNGTQVGATETNSTAYNRIATGGSQDLHIGRFLSGDATQQAPLPYSSFLNGYIDDLRITRGVARYTENFTAPTATFELK
jgi:hypothetical protein